MSNDSKNKKRSNGGARQNVAGRKRPHRKLTIDVKEAIAKAFELSGGVDYLVQVAKDDPRVFCALLQKIIPAEVKAEVNVSGKLVDAINEGRKRSGITIDENGEQC